MSLTLNSRILFICHQCYIIVAFDSIINPLVLKVDLVSALCDDEKTDH